VELEGRAGVYCRDGDVVAEVHGVVGGGIGDVEVVRWCKVVKDVVDDGAVDEFVSDGVCGFDRVAINHVLFSGVREGVCKRGKIEDARKDREK